MPPLRVNQKPPFKVRLVDPQESLVILGVCQLRGISEMKCHATIVEFF